MAILDHIFSEFVSPFYRVHHVSSDWNSLEAEFGSQHGSGYGEGEKTEGFVQRRTGAPNSILLFRETTYI